MLKCLWNVLILILRQRSLGGSLAKGSGVERSINDHTMRIGLFYPHTPTPHIRSSMVAELVPDVLDLEVHRRVVQACEEGGLDFLFSYDTIWSSFPSMEDRPAARKGALMSPMLMMALAAMSNRIGLVSTMHVGLLHPVVVARIGANLDALSGGRWALNIVSGTGGAGELISQVAEQADHDVRYAMASEGMEIVTRLWRGETLAYEGDFYRIRGALVRPLPVQQPYPALVSAGASAAGVRLAARWADWHFIPGRMKPKAARERLAQVDQALEAMGRTAGSVRSLRHVSMLVRDTPSEAQTITEWLLSTVEVTEGLRQYMSGSGRFSETYDSIYEEFGKDEDTVRRVGLSSGAIVIHGSPAEVADGIKQLYDEQACRGIALTFPLWHPEEIRRFTDGVLPILERMGVWVSPHRRGWTW